MKNIFCNNSLEYYDVNLYTSGKVINSIFDAGVYNSKRELIQELSLIRNNKYCTGSSLKIQFEEKPLNNEILEVAIFAGYLFHHF